MSSRCSRCSGQAAVVDGLCSDCRSFLLGDSDIDPSGRPADADTLSPLTDWPFRAWGPLVDLRDPDDLLWIKLLWVDRSD